MSGQSPVIPTRTYLGTPATAPGPDGPAMLRAFGVIRRDPLAYLLQAWHAHGDVVQFPIPRPPSYLVNDPAAVRRVLVDNARNYGKGTIQYRALSLVTGEGLLTADGPAWRRQRRMIQPAFHHQALHRLLEQVQAATTALLGRWSRQARAGAVDIDTGVMEAALDVVGRALFATDLTGEAATLTKATLQGLDVVIARARVPISPPAWVPTPANRRLRSANAALDGAVRAMVQQRQARGVGEADMLDLLMAMRDEDGVALSQKEIRDQMVTFIVAGHETVASALTWALALLAHHPQAQQQLQQEADQAASRPALGMEDLDALPFARAVIDETLRLYPPAWLITRSALGEDDLAGFRVPAGALVILSPWLLHRHPRLWPDAEAFRPGRFLDGSADRLGFIPFGAGPRLCIGRDFSYVEAVVMLTRIAAAFSIEPADASGLPRPDPLVTVRPAGGLHLRLTPRR
ncbi:MAG: cytochrome P450 [Actinomycetales bacterium]|nr:cytochrome P450 [Actinomycetales bacterium]